MIPGFTVWWPSWIGALWASPPLVSMQTLRKTTFGNIAIVGAVQLAHGLWVLKPVWKLLPRSCCKSIVIISWDTSCMKALPSIQWQMGLWGITGIGGSLLNIRPRLSWSMWSDPGISTRVSAEWTRISKVRTGLNRIFQGCQRHCATMMTRLASHADGLWFSHHNLKQHHMECNHVHYISLNKHRKWLHHSCQQYGVSVEMNFMVFTPYNTDVIYTAVVMLTIYVERICINTL